MPPLRQVWLIPAYIVALRLVYVCRYILCSIDLSVHVPMKLPYSPYIDIYDQGFFQEMRQGGGQNIAMKNMWGASLKHYRL